MPDTNKALFKQHKKSRHLISLTPLIDVVFILLLFFMTASNYQKWHSLSLDSSQSGQGQAEPHIILVRLKENSLDINGDLMTTHELHQFIKEKITNLPNLQVLVQPVGNIVVQRMVDIIDQINTAGCTSIALVKS